jgi:hypothetical protein
MNHPYYRISIITLLSIFLYNCNDQNASTTNTNADSATVAEKPAFPPPVFEKLLGTWQSENGKNFEQWKKNGDGTYQSDVYSLIGKDTSWKEQAHIYAENAKWIFENRVKDQNEGKAIKFTSIILTDNSVQFSNPVHDFPTDINYTVLDQNTLHAFIIGPNGKGGKDTIPYNSKRVQ